MRDIFPTLILIAGAGQLSVLVATAVVPIHLKWRGHFAALPRLHRQMYWVYGGYIVLAIASFGVICIVNAKELAGGSLLARSFCGYLAVFWGIRLALQGVLDVREHLTAWWLVAGEIVLTALFLYFTTVFSLAAIVS